MGDLTRFLSSSIKNEVFIVTENRCIKSNGVLLAARSAKIEEILEESENIPAVQFSDNMAGLEDCLDLVYSGSVDIRDGNCKSIYKFGKLFQICEMMVGVLAWIANSVTYDNFWKVYLDFENLHEDVNKSEFIAAAKRCLCTDRDNFVKHTTELCRGSDATASTITAVVELLSRIDDIRILSVMENIIDNATQNNEFLLATTLSTYANNHLPTVVSFTATYIENNLKANNCDEFMKSHCIQTLQKVSSVCTNMEALRTINKMLFDTSIQAITSILESYRNFEVHSIRDLNWKRVKQLTSSSTSYGAIKYFTKHAGSETGIHPCVVVEIVLKWWSERTGREHVDMSFIIPFITTIHTVSSDWYLDVRRDERYKNLIKTLDIPKPTIARFMYYSFYSDFYKGLLEDCINLGNGRPANLEIRLECSDTDNMRKYRQSIPEFRYNNVVFPPYRYRYTKHHWYITTSDPNRFVSLITDSQDKILNYIDTDNKSDFELNFVPLPGTFW